MTDRIETRTRQQAWEAEYRANPYLAGKPLQHVVERFRYVSESYSTLTDAGKLGLEVEKPLSLWLLSRLTHLFMEFRDRGGIPQGIQLKLPKLTHPETPPGVVAYQSRKRSEPGSLFKFGKQQWLLPMLNQGAIRFAPASSYSDASLNVAIQDDELGFTYFPSKSGPPLTKLPRLGGADWVHMRHPSDFYVQCFSLRFAPRLFEDFAANSCLIIYDPKEFGRRVLRSLRNRFPDWFVTAFGMTYIDPDNPGDEPILLPMAKHMRYIYQQEQRILCHPRKPVPHLEAVTIKVEALTDIAELISI